MGQHANKSLNLATPSSIRISVIFGISLNEKQNVFVGLQTNQQNSCATDSNAWQHCV